MLEHERIQIFREIETYFKHELDAEIDLTSQVQIITVNDYSYCFEFSSADQTYFAKVSKFNQLLLRKGQPIIPFSKKDIAFGLAEYESLIYLSEKIQAEGVKLIEVITYLQNTNTLISKKVEGEDLFLLLRRDSIQGFQKTPHDSFILMKNLTSFYLTVASSSQESFTTYNLPKTIEKIKSYLQALQIDFNQESKLLKSLRENLFKECSQINGYKGFDIRNVIYHEDGSLIILDPGKEKKEPIESFFSRIHATLLILFWGHPLFFFNKTLKIEHLNYFEENIHTKELNPIIFQLELRKELYKHWKMAVFALEQKSWPFIFKILLRKFYIDTFYIKHLKHNQSKLNKLNSEV
jgi:hypothetical protein